MKKTKLTLEHSQVEAVTEGMADWVPLESFCEAVTPTSIDAGSRRILHAILRRIEVRDPVAPGTKSTAIFTAARMDSYIRWCCDAFDQFRIADARPKRYRDPAKPRLDKVELLATKSLEMIDDLYSDGLGYDLCHGLDRMFLIEYRTKMKQLCDAARELRATLPSRPGRKPGGYRSDFVYAIVLEFREHFGFMPPSSRESKFLEFVATFFDQIGCPQPNCADLVAQAVELLSRACAPAPEQDNREI